MITKDMPITEVVQKYPKVISVLQKLNLGCIGCIAASEESLEQGLAAHGLDVDDVVKQMNKIVGNKNN